MSAASNSDVCLAIDIGGTRLRAGLVSDGQLLVSQVARTPTDGTLESLTGALRSLIDQLLSVAGAGMLAGGLDLPPPTRAGVCLPGWWDRDTGRMLACLNLPALEGQNVRAWLEQIVACPVTVETDVIAAAVAQWLHEPVDREMYLSVGTGVGGAVKLECQILRHTRSGPGHFGHLVVDTRAGAPRCRCGATGCLEAILHASRHADGAIHNREALINALAVCLVQLSVIYAPQRVLLGGGVLDANPDLVPVIATAYESRAGRLSPAGLKIQAAPVPADDAGMIGATLIAELRT